MSSVIAVALAAATLTGCVSRVGPAAAPFVTPPAKSPVAGECDTADIEVHGDITEEPSVTVPTGCAQPTRLLARDVIEGLGEGAPVGATLSVNYVLFTWSGGEELDSTWAGRDELPFEVANLGHAQVIQGWNQGLPGIREGGRRLLVVPATMSTGDADTGATLIYVVDAVRVSE